MDPDYFLRWGSEEISRPSGLKSFVHRGRGWGSLVTSLLIRYRVMPHHHSQLRPRPILAIRVRGGGLEPSAIAKRAGIAQYSEKKTQTFLDENLLFCCEDQGIFRM